MHANQYMKKIDIETAVASMLAIGALIAILVFIISKLRRPRKKVETYTTTATLTKPAATAEQEHAYFQRMFTK